jgi:hypothetical protein
MIYTEHERLFQLPRVTFPSLRIVRNLVIILSKSTIAPIGDSLVMRAAGAVFQNTFRLLKSWDTQPMRRIGNQHLYGFNVRTFVPGSLSGALAHLPTIPCGLPPLIILSSLYFCFHTWPTHVAILASHFLAIPIEASCLDPCSVWGISYPRSFSSNSHIATTICASFQFQKVSVYSRSDSRLSDASPGVLAFWPNSDLPIHLYHFFESRRYINQLKSSPMVHACGVPSDRSCSHPRASPDIGFFTASRSESAWRCDDARNADRVKGMNSLVNYWVSSSAPEFSPHFTSYRSSLFLVAYRCEAPIGDSLLLRAAGAAFRKFAQAPQNRGSHRRVFSFK